MMENNMESVQLAGEYEGIVVLDSSKREDSINATNLLHGGDEPKVNCFNTSTAEHWRKKRTAESLLSQKIEEKKPQGFDFNGDLFNLVVEDSLDREEHQTRPLDLNQLPEEEEVESKMMVMVDSCSEAISSGKDDFQFDLNKFPDDECDEDSNTEKERKRFIRSMLKLFFPDFY